MFRDVGPTVVQKRLSFPSVLCISGAAVAITLLSGVFGVGLYALRMVDRRADGLTGLVGQVAEHLPEWRAALPPALADAVNDERSAEYMKQLEVSARLLPDGAHRGRRRVIVEVKNNGDRIVSVLAMRFTGLDADDEPVTDWSTYPATPLQLDNEWRGPLMPREKRRLCMYRGDLGTAKSVEFEITELRVWKPESDRDATEAVADAR
jgi:hypothetical protein